MATSTFSGAWYNSTDAQFRGWGSALSNAFAAVGFVKTADTGQINWTTVVKPSSGSTYQGYEIWRFNDALQATAPLFIKFRYGSSGFASDPAVEIQVGKGSDGAGNITSSLITLAATGPNTSGAPTGSTYVSSGDGSLLSVAPAINGYIAINYPSAPFVIERSRDSGGAPTGDGVTVLRGGAYTGGAQAVSCKYSSGSSVTHGPGLPVALPVSTSADNSMAYGGVGRLIPLNVHDGQGTFWQPRGILVGMRQDVGSNTAITVTGYGNYITLGSAARACDAAAGAYASACLAWW